VFANGGGFDKGDANSDLPQQAFFNDAGASMTDVSADVFGAAPPTTAAPSSCATSTTTATSTSCSAPPGSSQSQLFLNDGAGNFSNETDPTCRRSSASVGDLELGDVDGDGDLDMILADWGADARRSPQLTRAASPSCGCRWTSPPTSASRAPACSRT
jgi:hypothetical protein